MANDFSDDPNCVALWSFESGALTTDSQGTNTLTDENTVGINTVDYKEGSACADFEYSSSEAMSITDANLDAGFPLKNGDTNKEISVCGWFKPEEVHEDRIFTIFSKDDTALSKRSLQIYLNPTYYGSQPATFVIRMGYNSGGSSEVIYEDGVYQAARWYHFGFTLKDSDKSWKFVVWDDTASSKIVDASGTATNNINIEDAALRVGATGGSGFSADRFDGLIDELVVFKDVLTAGEIDQIRAGTYSVVDPNDVSISEGFTSADSNEVWDEYAEISEGFTSDDAAIGMNTSCEISEGITMSSLFGQEGEGETDEDVTTDDVVSAIKEQYPVEEGEGFASNDALAVETETILAEGFTSADTYSTAIETSVIVGENLTVDDETVGNRFLYPIINDSFEIYDTIKSGWAKTIAESLVFTEAVDKILGITTNDPLTIGDETVSNWNGVEEVGSTLQMIGTAIVIEVFNETNSETLTINDVPTYLHQMISAIADTLGFTEGVTVAPEFNSTIAEALAITGIVEVLKTLTETNSETLTLTDTLGTGWSKTLSDTLGIADTVTPTFYAMVALTDSIAFTETVLQQFEIDESIADTIGFATTLALQRILNNTIEDTISFGITVELDGELWETWVMNSNAFNMSVYSGYEFNSYCVYSGTAYGAKSDGIYKLDGTTDDGTAFVSGIVLPETHFGTSRKKRFRSAYFGLSGGTTPAIRMETDSGSQTYTITNSKANLTRNLYGRDWVLKLQDFQSVDFIELVQIILTR